MGDNNIIYSACTCAISDLEKFKLIASEIIADAQEAYNENDFKQPDELNDD